MRRHPDPRALERGRSMSFRRRRADAVEVWRWSADHPLPLGASERAGRDRVLTPATSSPRVRPSARRCASPVRAVLGVTSEVSPRHARACRRRCGTAHGHRADWPTFCARGLIADRGPCDTPARRRDLYIAPSSVAGSCDPRSTVRSLARTTAASRSRDRRWRCRASLRTGPMRSARSRSRSTVRPPSCTRPRIDVRLRDRILIGGARATADSRSRARTPAASPRSGRRGPGRRSCASCTAKRRRVGRDHGPEAPTVLVSSDSAGPAPGRSSTARRARRCRAAVQRRRAALRVRNRERATSHRARRRSRSPTTGSARGLWTRTSRWLL